MITSSNQQVLKGQIQSHDPPSRPPPERASEKINDHHEKIYQLIYRPDHRYFQPIFTKVLRR